MSPVIEHRGRVLFNGIKMTCLVHLDDGIYAGDIHIFWSQQARMFMITVYGDISMTEVSRDKIMAMRDQLTALLEATGD